MPAATPIGLSGLLDFIRNEPGLLANIPTADIEGGIAAAELMNSVYEQAMIATGVNRDGVLTPADIRTLSDYIRANPSLYADFVEGHGNDEGNVETGYHLVQGDGGAYEFQGRDFIDTIGDALYHIGFVYNGERFVNEDGDQNERVDDVAGWLNYFVNGENRVFGTNRADTLTSGDYSFALEEAAHEIFNAGGGNDHIWAGEGNDTVFGAAGHDRSGGGMGDDLMYGGTGNDTLGGDEGNDRLVGDAGNDHLWGEEGNDLIIGGSGNDNMSGGEGNDRMAGGTQDDSVYGGAGVDLLWGGDGDDRVGGGQGNDRIQGNAGNDTLHGDEGNDIVSGGDGNDQVSGGAHNDWLLGWAGADTLSGGTGHDRLVGGAGNDVLYGGIGRDKLYGGAGNDSLYGQEDADWMRGEAGNDHMYGQEGNDIMSGGLGNDTMSGGSGNDLVAGQAGNDSLRGGEGSDRIIGGTGVDEMADWEDVEVRDIFVFAQGDTGVGEGNRDVVLGFTSGTDQLDLQGFGALSLGFGASLSGSGRGEVVFDDNVLSIDTNGDGTADAEIELRYVSSLSLSDFVLA